MGDLGKLIVAKGFKKLPKVQKIAQSGHTEASLQFNWFLHSTGYTFVIFVTFVICLCLQLLPRLHYLMLLFSLVQMDQLLHQYIAVPWSSLVEGDEGLYLPKL